MEPLLPIVMEVGEVNLKCMALLDAANTQTYGSPRPIEVSLTVEKGPFIIISGHDLRDLDRLLKQTEGKGVNVYTHGEMLPAHGYPELKKYPHLKGNFGTAWQLSLIHILLDARGADRLRGGHHRAGEQEADPEGRGGSGPPDRAEVQARPDVRKLSLIHI